jgi:cytochrome subunit of sulfide dehydrogenase
MHGSTMLKLALALTAVVAGGPASAQGLDKLVESCEACHGKDGYSTTADVPIIAGFSREGFVSTIDAFRKGKRIAMEFHRPGEPETVMNDIARALSDEDVPSLAEHFSARSFRPAPQSADLALAKAGAKIHKKWCERCHSENGAHPDEEAAILAGQWTPYLRRQFENVLSGKRKVPKPMLERVRKLSAADIEALLQFYADAGLQAATEPAP